APCRLHTIHSPSRRGVGGCLHIRMRNLRAEVTEKSEIFNGDYGYRGFSRIEARTIHAVRNGRQWTARILVARVVLCTPLHAPRRGRRARSDAPYPKLLNAFPGFLLGREAMRAPRLPAEPHAWLRQADMY